jgi:hypothetical protein
VASAPEPTPAAANPTTDAEADAPTDSSIVAAPSAAADEEAAIAAEEAISSPAPPLPSGAQLSRTQSIHAVEGASLTLEAFVKWYNRVTSEFKPDVRTKVLETLEDYVAKMCKADRLFKLWDHDDSGTLDHDEIVSVLSWFEKHIPGDDIEFATIWDADKEADTAREEPEEPDAAPATAAPAAATAADEEPETAEDAKAMEDPEAPEAPPPAPVAVTGKAVKRVPLRKMFNPMTAIDNAFAGFPEWIASVVASLTPVGDADPDTATPTMNPMALFFQSDTKANLKLTLVQFRRWLMSVAGQLEASTYAAALDQLCGAPRCAHRSMTPHTAAQTTHSRASTTPPRPFRPSVEALSTRTPFTSLLTRFSGSDSLPRTPALGALPAVPFSPPAASQRSPSATSLRNRSSACGTRTGRASWSLGSCATSSPGSRRTSPRRRASTTPPYGTSCPTRASATSQPLTTGC